MQQSFKKILQGYHNFRQKYAAGDNSVMENLAAGQNPEAMIVSCCDSRVDPALILQCDPGDLFITRNVANLIPPFERDHGYHGTSAALEFGVCYLHVKHLIIFGHSQCGGINAFLNQDQVKHQDDFISHWVSLIKSADTQGEVDQVAKQSLYNSYKNCLTFPWIKQRLENNSLQIHLWFFEIKTGEILSYSFAEDTFQRLT